MDTDILLERLRTVGFTEKEARVYLASLESPGSPVARIAAGAGMNRITAYSILEKLCAKGAMSVSDQEGRRIFTPLSTEILAEGFRQKADNFDMALPHLKSLLGGHPNRPMVRFFQGIEAVKQAYQETLRNRSPICNYANSRTIRAHWPEYDQEYVQKRKERAIFLRGVAPDDEYGRRVQSQDEEFYRETRLLPPGHFQVENEINIFADKLLIASFEPQTFAILIESTAVAGTQRQIFEIIWGFAEKRAHPLLAGRAPERWREPEMTGPEMM